MFKWTTEYKGFDTEETFKETFYFNLTEAEILDWQGSRAGGMDTYIEKLKDRKDFPSLMETVKEFVTRSYGVKSDDGRKFIKSEEALNDFMQTEAFNEFYMKLYTDSKFAQDFINGIYPESLKDKITEINKNELNNITK